MEACKEQRRKNLTHLAGFNAIFLGVLKPQKIPVEKDAEKGSGQWGLSHPHQYLRISPLWLTNV
jgi:hypothetical protein